MNFINPYKLIKENLLTSILLSIYTLYQTYFLFSSVWQPLYYTPFIFTNVLIAINLALLYVRPSVKSAFSALDNLSPLYQKLLFYAVVLVVPIYEELLFRYCLPSHISWVLGKSPTNFVCSLIFGLAHAFNILILKDKTSFASITAIAQQVCLTFLLGLVICMTDSLLLGFLLHMHYNMLSFTIAGFIVREPKKELKKAEVETNTDIFTSLGTFHQIKRRASVSLPKSCNYLTGQNLVFVADLKPQFQEQWKTMNKQLADADSRHYKF
jgi:membrane protease YdiL (CAAX protease family)